MTVTPSNKPGPDRRALTQGLVRKLIAERTHMLVLFCRAAGLDSVTTNDEPVEEVVRDFCQVLVDYVAAGHFTLYDRIVRGEERRQGVKELAAKVYPKLDETTQAALDFNDAYQNPAAARDLKTLSEDMSKLGEHLAARIELEDQLLARFDPTVASLR